MDVISTATATATVTATHAGVKTPEAESETPSRVQPSKPLSFPNGVLKRHHPLPQQQQHHHHHHLANAQPVVVTYKECLKNHAASLGGHALDGCGEFMPSPTATPADPTSLKCAACGCHRNFHRRDPDESLPHSAQHFVEFQPHHRHHPPPPPRDGQSSPDSPSPLPISSAYYPSAPHMLLALSAGLSGHPPENYPSLTAPTPNTAMAGNSNGRKRFRTKFTQDQKDKMYAFAERVGWKIQKRDEDLISEFCSEVGVDRGVLKVWMHNNKNTLGKKDLINTNSNNNSSNGNASGNANAIGIGIGVGGGEETATHCHHHNHQHNNDINSIDDNQKLSHHLLQNNDDSVSTPHVVTTNGTSSSS